MVDVPGNPRTTRQRSTCDPCLASSSNESEANMIVPVFVPTSRIDAADVAVFARTVGEHVARYGCMVVDCSTLVWITTAGMRVLETASHDAQITLVNPTPAVHLMAAAFGGDVQCRYDKAPSPAPENEMHGRWLTSVRPGGKVAS
jgi:anti-anti-sigma regulatory factor